MFGSPDRETLRILASATSQSRIETLVELATGFDLIMNLKIPSLPGVASQLPLLGDRSDALPPVRHRRRSIISHEWSDGASLDQVNMLRVQVMLGYVRVR